MGWGNKWEGATIIDEASSVDWPKILKADPVLTGIDFGTGDSHAIMTTFDNGEIKHRAISNEELYNNLKPTHDPYTNPNAHIYYECGCGAILDPQTKSFAALNNYASDKGWKIRFTDKGYVPYCVKCGKGVE